MNVAAMNWPRGTSASAIASKRVVPQDGRLVANIAADDVGGCSSACVPVSRQSVCMSVCLYVRLFVGLRPKAHKF